MAKITKTTVKKATAKQPKATTATKPTKKATVATSEETVKPKKTTKKVSAETKKITTKTATVTKKTAAKTTKPATKKPAAAPKTPKAKPVSLVETIAQAMLDKKAQEVVSLDLSELGIAICDHFVIGHASSTVNVQAIADNVEKEVHDRLKQWPFRVQGKENAFWIILDYIDVVVHIFQTEYRQFYRLEELWADAVHKEYAEAPIVKKTKK